MLSRKQKEYFRKLLTQRLDEGLGKAQDTLAHISDIRDRFSDEMDEASFASDMGFSLRIRDREATLIRKIKDALERLEDGTFGYCEECGEEISYKRLKARPVATLCLQCKKDQEAAERLRAERDRGLGYWAS
jgi:DnaK suppressor protein